MGVGNDVNGVGANFAGGHPPRTGWGDARPGNPAPSPSGTGAGEPSFDLEHQAQPRNNPALELGGEDRLPWLESADDIEPGTAGPGHTGLIGAGIFAVALLVSIVGGIYWLTHRGSSRLVADGSLIEADKAPYKIAPSNPGGKTFAGTGDSSFKVSQGQHPNGSLAGSAGTTPAPAASASPGAAPSSAVQQAKPMPVAPVAVAIPAEVAAGGGVGVQIGAFSSEAGAETAWNKLVAGHDALKGLSHRVIEGKADIGTVYRLQAITSDPATATALCSHLLAGGLKCQVKR